MRHIIWIFLLVLNWNSCLLASSEDLPQLNNDDAKHDPFMSREDDSPPSTFFSAITGFAVPYLGLTLIPRGFKWYCSVCHNINLGFARTFLKEESHLFDTAKQMGIPLAAALLWVATNSLDYKKRKYIQRALFSLAEASIGALIVYEGGKMALEHMSKKQQ